jgi:hypothetical protein
MSDRIVQFLERFSTGREGDKDGVAAFDGVDAAYADE